jgi:DNA mismatch endonuclease, patch repair protein
MDILTKEKRSWNMGRIRSINTTPEKAVRSILHRNDFRFRLHKQDLPGKPDIVLTKYKTVIEVRGCFWHRHKGCKFAYNPKSRIDFWQKKFIENISRDNKNEKELKKSGWKVIVIWECELKNLDKLEKKLLKSLKLGKITASGHRSSERK